MSDAAANTPATPKSELSKSESWVTIVAVLGSIAPMLGAGEAKWVSLIAALIAAASYAYFHTSLPSDKPGWKTPAFWGAIATIGGSVALVLTKTDFSFLPVGVTKFAAIAVTALTAAGYTLYRYNTKQTLSVARSAAPPAGPTETPTPPSVPKKAA
jgi:hypothetical protein